MFQAVLSNKNHMEYGVVTVPFPIPEDQYTEIIKMLEVLHVGNELSRDCMVKSIVGDWPVLRVLTGREVNLDELDYLAKRLDSFSPYERVQFQASAERYGLTQVTDLINLTFCCDQATVIVDFSDLEQVGRIHYLTLNGGATREEMESLDGYETALLLINEHPGTITPYGVFYDMECSWSRSMTEDIFRSTFMRTPSSPLRWHQMKICLLYTSPSPRDCD